MEVADAKQALEQAGYDADVDDQSDALDFNADNNKVCSVEPPAGKVAAGGEVKVVAKSDPEDCRTESEKEADRRAAAARAPKLTLSRKRSYCEQLGTAADFLTVGTQIKVVVYLKNSGETAAKDVSFMVRRTYQTGKTVDPIGDMVVDVEVPADGKFHPYRINYEVGPNYRVTGCTLHDIDNAPGIDGKEFELRVENSIIDI
jgi:beta-lactam-binding protein with PASTA domain